MKKHFISFGMTLLCMAAHAQYPTNGLVAYFPLDNTQQGNDAGPNNITPVASSFTTGVDRHGDGGGAFYYDGSPLYYIEYDMSVHTALKVEGDITIAFYAKVQGYNTGTPMPTAISLSDKVRAGFNVLPVTPQVTGLYGAFDRNSGGTTVSATSSFVSSIAADGWRFYAFVKEGDNLTMYRDANVVGTASGYAQDVPFTVNDVSMVIGQNQNLADGSFRGWLDDVFIYDRALTVNELNDLMAIEPCEPITGILTVDGPTSICADGEATYSIQIGQQNATNYIWEYNGGTGTLTNGSVTITAPSEGQGNPTLTIYGINECSQGAQFAYAPAVVGTPEPFTIFGNTLVCSGTGQFYEVESTGIPVTWDFPNGWVQNTTLPNNIGGQFSVGESGTISFTRDNGCFTRTETLEVTVVPAVPSPVTLADPNTELCNTQQATISLIIDNSTTSVSQEFPFPNFNTWSFATDTDTSFFVTPQGNSATATVSIYAGNVCGTTLTQFTFSRVGPAAPVINYGPFPGMLFTSEVVSVSYQWFLDGVPLAGETSNSLTYTQSGGYQLQATVQGCSVLSNAINVVVDPVGVVQVDGTEALKLYPNPFQDIVVVEFDGTTQVRLLNTLGKMVLSQTISGRTTLDVSNLPSGIYFFQHETSGDVMKLVKN